MSKPSKWIRHETEDGPRWSPITGDKSTISEAGREPSPSSMESYGPVQRDQLDVLPPVTPKRVVALAKNRRSADDDPLVFLKTPSSIVGHGDPIRLPKDREKTWSEVELAFTVSKTATDVSAADAESYIQGYTIANDVTMVNPTGRDLHLARGKALDTFCPVGPYLVNGIDTVDLTVKTSVNGDVTLETSTKERMMDASEALAEISSILTLEPGDLVLTGAPVNPRDSVIAPGDTTTVEVEGIGELTNPVEQR
jgi:2-keto-4-pentenoate hydratase/2-oxohepta-3-ene-1,7-dioic acid hydratase in catechol pathway